jgi:hypothetical protein
MQGDLRLLHQVGRTHYLRKPGRRFDATSNEDDTVIVTHYTAYVGVDSLKTVRMYEGRNAHTVRGILPYYAVCSQSLAVLAP